MKLRFLRRLAVSLGGVLVILAGVGCGSMYPIRALLDGVAPDAASARQEANALDVSIAPFPASTTAAAAAASAVTVPPDLRLSMKAGPPGPFPRFRNLPNTSTGTFICQTTIAYAGTTGLRSGQSAAGIRSLQPDFPAGSRTRYIGAVYHEPSDGWLVYVTNLGSTQFGPTRLVGGTHQVDVRMEQTDTALVFSYRPTPSDQSAEDWIVIFSESTAPDPAPLTLGIGLINVDEDATFYFTHLAMDGEAIGGEAESTVLRPLRTTVEALRLAHAKLSLAAPDFPGALLDLDAAIAAHRQARKALKTAFVDYTLQHPTAGLVAQKGLVTAEKSLLALRAVVAVTSDPNKAKAQLPKLKKLEGDHLAAMVNIFGRKSPSVKGLPPELIYLSVP